MKTNLFNLRIIAVLAAFFVLFGITQSYAQYCTAGASVQDEHFTNVTFGSINNSSGYGTGGYSDFTSMSTTITIGNSYPISATISPFYGGDNVGVWIDYDHNFVFDASELTTMTGAASSTGTITVPAGAMTGTTRLRIRVEYYGSYNPCGIQSYGEVEDYTVNVIASSACSGTPAPGNTLSTLNPVCAGSNFTLSLQNATTGSGITYQWYSSTDGITYGPITGATNSTYTSTLPVATWFYCAVTCSGYGTGNSTPLQLTVGALTDCYCMGTYSYCGSSYGNDITNVTFGTINNTTAAYCNLPYCYTSYTSLSTAVTQGLSYPISISCSAPDYTWWGIWVDWNNDGDFIDAGEYTSIYAAYTTNGTGTILVDPAATVGSHRMRIRASYSSDPGQASVCSLLTYGEQEDYTVIVYAQTACSGTPAPGNTLSTLNPVCPSVNFTLSTQNFTPGSGVTYQWYMDGLPVGPTTATWTTNQTTAHSYYCAVTCSGNTGNSTALTVTMNSFMGCYCAISFSYATTDEDIWNVTMGTLNQTSTCSTLAPGAGSVMGSYSNYIGFAPVPDLTQGTNESFSVTLAYCGTYAYSNIAAIYIDWDHNGIFDEAAVWTSAYGALTFPSQVMSGSFLVPPGSTLGNTVMRVVYNESNTAPACGAFYYGEAEDYMVNVIANSNCSGYPTAGTITASANPACSGSSVTLTLTGASMNPGVTYQWLASANGTTNWNNVGTGGLTYTFTMGAEMYYKVVVCCTYGGCLETPVIHLTLGSNCQCYTYCASSAVYTADDEILNVTFGSLSNSSTCSELAPGPGSVASLYSNYTTLPWCNTSFDIGQSVSGSVKIGMCGTYAYTTSFGVYIDWGQDGFTAADLVFSVAGVIPAMTGTTYPFTITIPANAVPGCIRMRVVDNESSSVPPPCGTSNYWGETEDYCIHINTPPPCTVDPTGITVTGPANTCGGNPITVGLAGLPGLAGYHYQWYENGLTVGTDSPTYTFTPTVSGNYTYTCWIYCENVTTGGGMSAPWTVSVVASPNDDCVNVLPVVLASGVPQVFNGSTLCATSTNDGAFNSSPNVWHVFTITTCADVVVSYCGTPAGTLGNVWLNLGTACPANTFTVAGTFLSNCTDGNMSVGWGQLPAGTYYLPVLGDYPGYNTPGPYVVTVTATECPAPPVNDDCAGAIEVFCGTTINGTTSGATVGTDDANNPCFTESASPSVWYKIVGDGSTMSADLCGSFFDTWVDVYSGTCGALTCVGNNDNYCGTWGYQSSYTWTSVVGTTYYIRVHGSPYGYGNNVGQYSLSITCCFPPANDDCSGAIPVSMTDNDSKIFTGTTACATMSAIEGSSFGMPVVWEAFTLTACANVSIQICYANTPQYLQGFIVLAPNCPFVFNDLFWSTGWTLTPNCITFSYVLPAGTYYIPVAGTDGFYNTPAGPYTVTVTTTPNPTCPVNDACADAIPIPYLPYTTPAVDNAGASTDGTSSCGDMYRSIWYTVTSPICQTLTASSCNLTTVNTKIAVYSGTDCNSLVPVGCNEDYCGAQSQVSWQAYPGVTYYIALGAYAPRPDYAPTGPVSMLVSGDGIGGFATSIICPPATTVGTNVGCLADGVYLGAAIPTSCNGVASITNNTTYCPGGSGSTIITIDMYDSFGDGWNGGTLYAYNGATLLGTYTLATGTYGQATLSVATGTTVTWTYTQGSWIYEPSFTLSVGGVVIYSTPNPIPNGTLFTYTVPAPSCWIGGIPLGTHAVTWMVTDNLGSSAVCDQLVTVVDDVLPTIQCQDMAVNTDQGACFATVTLTPPATGDNCSVGMVTNDLAPSCNYQINMFDSFGDGWNGGYLDIYINGSLIYGNITLATGSSGIYSFSAPAGALVEFYYTLGTWTGEPSYYIYLNGSQVYVGNGYTPGLVYTSSCPAGPSTYTFAPGVHAVIWTVYDGSGNTASCVQNITVTDIVPPVIYCPQDIIVNNDPSVCGAFVYTLAATAEDECGIQYPITNSYNSGPDATGFYPVGTTQVIWTAYDVNGNASTCIQNITVNDVEPPMLIACAPDKVLCYQDSFFDVYTDPPQVWDNCGPAGLSMTNDHVPPFQVGDNYVNWTIQDMAGNIITCTQHVVLSGPITVSISESQLPTFCQGQGVMLTADVVPAGAAASYLWSTGATTQEIFATQTGQYCVTAYSALGCPSTACYNATVNVTDMLSSYVMLTRNHIKLERSTVYSGGLGVKGGKDAKIEAKKYSTVTAAGTFAKALHINIDGTSTITNKFYTHATVAWPAFEIGATTGGSNVNVPNGATQTLTGSLYKEIKVGKNATVIFTQPVVDITKKMNLEDGSTVIFNNTCTKIRMHEKLEAKHNVTINPSQMTAIWYIDDDVKFEGGANVNAIFYLGSPTSQDTVKHHMHIGGSKKNDRPAVFRGMFLAECIHSGEYTSWYMSTICNNCVFGKDDAIVLEDNVDANAPAVENYPNPFSNLTTISFTMPADNHVTIDVYDLTGKLVQTIFNGDVNASQRYNVEFDGSTLPTGVYMYKMTTNDDVFTGKMILTRE